MEKWNDVSVFLAVWRMTSKCAITHAHVQDKWTKHSSSNENGSTAQNVTCLTCYFWNIPVVCVGMDCCGKGGKWVTMSWLSSSEQNLLNLILSVGAVSLECHL